jgi:hypothetical protein
MIKPIFCAGTLLLAAFLAAGAPQARKPRNPETQEPGKEGAGEEQESVLPPHLLEPPVKFVELTNRNVTSAKRRSVSLFTEMGTLETEGYKEMTVNLFGSTKGSPDVEGEVGVLFIPDIPTVMHFMREERKFLGALEVTAKATERSWTIFSAPQKSFKVGFPRYRVYAYNQTIRSSKLELHIALSR